MPPDAGSRGPIFLVQRDKYPMKNLILIAGLAFGLAACGGEDQQAVEDDGLANDAAEVAEQMTDAVNEVVEDVVEETGPTMADLQEAFLANYAQGDGTVLTDTGLLYRVEREGEGASPGETDTVEVHYEGRLVDGTVFDSSYERDETIEFPLNRVIAGWTEGLQYMQEGAKYQFVIPPELGYGSRGAGDVIPPDAVLVFDVELFRVTPAQ